MTRTVRRALAVAAVNGFLGWAVVGLFLGLISSVADRFLGLGDPLVAGGLTAALLVCSTLTVPAVTRLGPRRAQLVGLVALAVSLVVLAPGVNSLVAVLVACVVAGLANGLLYSGATAIVATMAPPQRASGTAAAVYSAFYLGAGLPTLLVGLLTTVLPLDTALSAIALGALALTALMIVLSTVDSRRAAAGPDEDTIALPAPVTSPAGGTGSPGRAASPHRLLDRQQHGRLVLAERPAARDRQGDRGHRHVVRRLPEVVAVVLAEGVPEAVELPARRLDVRASSLASILRAAVTTSPRSPVCS